MFAAEHPMTPGAATPKPAAAAPARGAPALPETVVESQPLVSPRLAAYYAEAAARRAGQFVEVPERVAGLPLRPLTADSFSLLCLTNNRCILSLNPEIAEEYGEEAVEDAVTFKDLRDFCWIHWQWFIADGRAGRSGRLELTRELYRRLNPGICGTVARILAPVFQARAGKAGRWSLSRPLAKLARRFARPAFADALSAAAAEACAIVDEAFADAAAPDDNSPELGLGFVASFVDRFSAEHRWTPERTRAMPLKQLFAVLRCSQIRNGGEAAAAKLITRKEARILSDELSAPAAAPTSQPPVPEPAFG